MEGRGGGEELVWIHDVRIGKESRWVVGWRRRPSSAVIDGEWRFRVSERVSLHAF